MLKSATAVQNRTKAEERASAGVYITNTGKSPALDLKLRYGTRIPPQAASMTPDYHKMNQGASVLFPGSRVILLVPVPFREGEKITTANVQAIEKGTITVYVRGEISYRDIFDRPHQTTFCMYLTRDRTAFNASETYNSAN